MNNNLNNNEEEKYIEGIDPEELTDSRKLSLTPEQHERLKNKLHGNLLNKIKRAEQRYLVIGSGRGKQKERRQKVQRILNDRSMSIAIQLEDFKFTKDEIDLWVPAFEILSEMMNWIVGVLEDYEGGYIWELGYLYSYQRNVRDILWILKRIYDDAETSREKYDNGMAEPHLTTLEKSIEDRVIAWREIDDLIEAVKKIP